MHKGNKTMENKNLTYYEGLIYGEILRELKQFEDGTTMMYTTNICWQTRIENKLIRAILVSLQKKGFIRLFKHNGESMIEVL